MNRCGAILTASLVYLVLTGSMTRLSAETMFHKTTVYFSIGGKTAEDLDREMLRRGPVSKITGRRHPGATQINFAGSATFVGKNGHCVIGGAKVSLTTKILLPRWANRRKADRHMALIWDTLSADIKRHEERHAEIARGHAKALEKAILALPPASNCDQLKAKVNSLSQLAMVEHDRDQQQFDRIESANFENRMARLLKYRVEARKTQ
jgi:predicted secreted Zn-dependent protease